MYNAVTKLQAIGPSLGYPHSSAVRDAARLRELRPREPLICSRLRADSALMIVGRAAGADMGALWVRFSL